MAWTFGDGGHEGNADLSKGLGGPAQSLYSATTVQNFPLGFKKEFTDGRIFRYAHFVSAVGAGKIAAIDTSVGINASIDAKFTDSGGTAKDDYGTDDNVIYLTDTDSFSTTDAADVFAGGYFQITDAAGEAFSYRIESNAVGTAAGLMRLDLYDNLASALDSETSAAIIGNRFKNLAIANGGTDDAVLGVTTATMGAAEYGWVQTNGVGVVLADETAGTVAGGTVAVLSDGVDGAAEPLNIAAATSETDVALLNFAEPIIGHFLTAAVDTEYVPIYLELG